MEIRPARIDRGRGMARARKDTLTLDLFDVPRAPAHAPGALNFSIKLRAVLSAALKATPLSRYEVAARMSELLGTDITKSMLDAWTAESREPWRFPFEYAAAFEAVCDTTCLQDLFSEMRGSKVLKGEDSLLAELGRIEQMEHNLKREKQQIKNFLARRK